MPESNEMQTIVVTLRKNGDLTIDDEGEKLVIGHYNRNAGHLEFETKEYSVKLYNQACGAIGSIAKGKLGADPSGNLIKSIGIKGIARVDRKNLPPKPKMGPLGDAAKEIFDWYMKHMPEEGKIRYRLYLDNNGDPIRLPCKRVIVSTEEMRNVDNEDLPWQDLSKKHRERGPVFRVGDEDYAEEGYVAGRETERTFLPSQVIGGFQPDDELAGTPDSETTDRAV